MIISDLCSFYIFTIPFFFLVTGKYTFFRRKVRLFSLFFSKSLKIPLSDRTQPMQTYWCYVIYFSLQNAANSDVFSEVYDMISWLILTQWHKKKFRNTYSLTGLNQCKHIDVMWCISVCKTLRIPMF